MCVGYCQVLYSSENYPNIFLLKETDSITKYSRENILIQISWQVTHKHQHQQIFSLQHLVNTLSLFQKGKILRCTPNVWSPRCRRHLQRPGWESAIVFSSVEFSTVLLTPLNGKVFHGVGRFGGLQGFLNYQLGGQPVYYRVMEGDIR